MEFAKKKLQEELKKLAASKDIQVVFDVKKGDTYETILKEQQKKGIDLIVLASHGKRGLINRLGSVADKVMSGARCPVLLVKE
jgi:nucleotide-binding universal stress UspA family protein